MRIRPGDSERTALKMKFKLLVVVCFAAGLLVVSQFAAAQDDSAKPATGSSAAPDPAASTSGGADVLPNLPPGTKSVMKRPADGTVNVRAGYDGPPMVPVRPNRFNDPAVQQAGGANADATTAAAGAANASKAPADAGDPRGGSRRGKRTHESGTDGAKGYATRRPTDNLARTHARVGTDRNRQLAIVRGYWKLSATQADYNWAIDEGARLDQVAAAKGLKAAVLSVAQAGGQARVHEAQVGAVAAQQELADLLAWPSTTPLPLAADPPLVGPYRTYFDTLFAGRVPPARTRVIDRSLPIRLQAIQDRTLAVQAASSAIRYAEDARGKGQVDLQALLNCHAELARQRRAFLSTVRDYNLDIGEYALAVADPTLPNERLVAMLIVVRPAAASASAQ